MRMPTENTFSENAMQQYKNAWNVIINYSKLGKFQYSTFQLSEKQINGFVIANIYVSCCDRNICYSYLD